MWTALCVCGIYVSGFSVQFGNRPLLIQWNVPTIRSRNTIIPPLSPAASFLHFSFLYSPIVCLGVERATCRALRLAFSFTPHSGTQSPTSLSLHSEHNVSDEEEDGVVVWWWGVGGRGGWLGSASACQSEPVAPSSLLLIEMSSVTKTTWQLGLNGAVELMPLCFNCFLPLNVFFFFSFPALNDLYLEKVREQAVRLFSKFHTWRTHFHFTILFEIKSVIEMEYGSPQNTIFQAVNTNLFMIYK